MNSNMNITVNYDSTARCCACLSPGVRLFNIHKNKLADAFTCILGTPVLQEELPQHLCAFCCTMLLKCKTFRDMCLRAQKLVSDLVDGELDLDLIQGRSYPPHQFYNLHISQVEIVDCTLPEDIKVEPNIEIDDINSFIENIELKVEFENENDELKINDDSGNDVTDVKDTRDIKRRKRKILTARKKKEVEIEFDNDDVDRFISEQHDKCLVKKKKVKEKNEDKKKVELESDADLTKIVKKVEGKIKNKVNKDNAVSDLAAFEKEYTVQIVNLSKEEQLEEIALRKKSRNYVESRFRCEGCGRGYDAEAAYNNHLLRHSPSAGGLVCQLCSLRFKIKSRLQKHLESHQFKFICQSEGCSFVSRDRAYAKTHHTVHLGKTFECQHCGKSFFNKSKTYRKHVRLSHPAMNVACDVCGETFVSQKGCRLHKNRMHPENPKPQIHTCSSCSANFVSLEALDRHTDTAGEHAHTHARPCEQCGESCASETALHQHVAENHASETHRCEECNMTFSSLMSFDIHHRRKHLNQQPRRSRHVERKKYKNKPRKKRQFVCEQCGMIKPSEAFLRYHQRSHDGVKPFACDHCPKSFRLKSALVWHMRTHTGEKPHQCAECPRAFRSKANYNRHRDAVHLGIRGSFPCAVCARVFSTRWSARVHVNTVHDDTVHDETVHDDTVHDDTVHTDPTPCTTASARPGHPRRRNAANTTDNK